MGLGVFLWALSKISISRMDSVHAETYKLNMYEFSTADFHIQLLGFYGVLGILICNYTSLFSVIAKSSRYRPFSSRDLVSLKMMFIVTDAMMVHSWSKKR